MTYPTTLESLVVRVVELEKQQAAEIKHLRDIIDRSAVASAHALQLQANEYERRLAALNGEAERLIVNQLKSVSRELFDAAKTEQIRRISSLEVYRSNIEGKIWGISLAVGAIVTLLNIGLQFIK